MRRLLTFAAPLPLLFAVACDRDAGATASPSTTQIHACRSRVAPEELLPADAVFVAMYDMQRERKFAPRKGSAVNLGLRTLVPFEMETVRAGWISIAAACQLDPQFFGEAWLAFDREADVLGVLSGNGIGDPDNLRCIRGRMAQWGDDFVEDSSIVTEGCGVSIEFEDLAGFAPNDDLLVLGTATAVDRAKQRYNAGIATPPSALMPARRNKSYVWAAADLDALLGEEDMADVLAATGRDDLAAIVGIQHAWAEASLSRRLKLSLSGRFTTEADARAAEGVLAAWIVSPPPALPSWARDIITKLRIERGATEVTLSLPLKRSTAQTLGLLPTKPEAEQMPALAWAVGLALVL